MLVVIGLDKSQTLGSQPGAVQCEDLKQFKQISLSLHPLLDWESLSDCAINLKQS